MIPTPSMRHGRQRIVTGGLSGRPPTKKSAPRITSKCSTTAFRSRTSLISKVAAADRATRRRDEASPIESMEEQNVLAHWERTCPRRQHSRRRHGGGADPLGDRAGQGGGAGFL